MVGCVNLPLPFFLTTWAFDPQNSKQNSQKSFHTSTTMKGGLLRNCWGLGHRPATRPATEESLATV